ncbi:MAG: AMP-binding protein [Verrucomicrobiota bacterium]
MDASLLTTIDFWNDAKPFAAGDVPELPELAGHVLFETSGSSGNPKWVALTKPALLASAAAVNRHLRVSGESCWGLALPLNHVGGFGVAARACEARCRLETFDRRWDPSAFRDWLASTGVTHTSLVPTQVHDLVKAALTAPSSLLAIVVGGGHLDAATGQAARDLGWPVLASYGMSEAASQIATQGPDLLDAPYHSAPIPLLPIWQAEITPGGLLCISGPALFSGYVSEGKFMPRVAERHVTSDRVLLENRAITPLGRADTLVKVLGELVDPESIESELAALSQGRLIPGTFAIVALPDERAGNALVPVFESQVDAEIIGSVLGIYQSQAAGFRRLGPAKFIGRFPRSGLGKLKRAELAAMASDLST